VPFFWGTWKFSQNKSTAKSLLTFLCQRSSVEQTVAASHGYDIPPFAGLHDFQTWLEESPPKGTVYHYPPRGDVVMVIPYSPAPARIANQIYAQATVPKMIAKCTVEGNSIETGPPPSSKASAGLSQDQAGIKAQLLSALNRKTRGG
jgi:hypothetical protein